MTADQVVPTVDTGRPVAFETASESASPRVPSATGSTSAGEVLRGLRGREFDSAAAIAVLDGDRLVGVASIERVLSASDDALLSDIMDPMPPTATSDTDQEHAAWQAVNRDEGYLAVVDDAGCFVGFIPPQRLLAVLLEEHDEDIARFGGFLRDAETARRSSVESVLRRLWHRLPWLIVGLVGAMVSALLMTAFEARIDANLAVAYFVPGIVYLADAVGTQTETLAIRGLSVGVGIRSIAGREALTGAAVGVLLGVVILPTVELMTGDWGLAVAVSVAVLAASTIATVVALVLPLLLHRWGRDPAFGSGPLATVVQDLLSILIYFAAVTLLLG